MNIDGAAVLHMVDDATYFSAAQFIKPLTNESVWETIITLWDSVYIESPNTLVFDNFSQFRDTFVEICEIHHVEWQSSATKHHSAP